MFRKLLIGFVLFITGAAVAFGILRAAGSVLRFDDPRLAVVGIRKPQIVGFLPYWLLSKADKDYTQYLTTLTYFGLVVDADGKPIYLAQPGEEEPGWTALKGEKAEAFLSSARKQNLKRSLLVHSADEEKIAELIQNPEVSARALVSEVAPLMTNRGFTDLNLDIESFRPASVSARTNFAAFVRTVTEEIRAANLGTVTIEIAPIAFAKQFLIDPNEIGAMVDYVVLMAYDYHYSGSLIAGPVAPVGGAGSEREFDVEVAVAEAVRRIPKEKILLGIPLYGYQWETLEKMEGSATIPGGASTASTRRVSELLSVCATCSAVIDPVSREPYVIVSQDGYYKQIYYENESSLREKILLAEKYSLGGVALWALGYEDDTMLTPLSDYKRSYTW